MIEKLKLQLSLGSRQSSFENGPKSGFEIQNEYNNFNAHQTPRELSGDGSIEDRMSDKWNQKLKLRYPNGRHSVMGDSRISHMMRFKKVDKSKRKLGKNKLPQLNK